MANVARIQEQSRRAGLATDGSSYIINKKLLKKKLRRLFYADDAKKVIRIMESLDGREFKEPPKKLKSLNKQLITSEAIKLNPKLLNNDTEIC